MEETTTSTPVDDTQAPVADATEQPDTTEQAVDGQETSETTSSEPEKKADSKDTAEETDDDIKAWAEKKGLSLEDPVALAKMVREGDKKVTEATQQASQLKSSVTSASAELDDIQQLRNEVGVMNFYQQYPDARELDSEMSKVLDEKPYFANDLEGLYFYTKGVQADKGLVAAKQAGSKEALEATAQAERASTPKASATNRTSPKEITDEEIRNMNTKEYQEAVASGKINPWGPRPE